MAASQSHHRLEEPVRLEPFHQNGDGDAVGLCDLDQQVKVSQVSASDDDALMLLVGAEERGQIEDFNPCRELRGTRLRKSK